MASAVSRISRSETLQANLFQLFQPMGGVLASPLSRAHAGATQMIKKKKVHINRNRIAGTSQAGFSRNLDLGNRAHGRIHPTTPFAPHFCSPPNIAGKGHAISSPCPLAPSFYSCSGVLVGYNDESQIQGEFDGRK